MAGKATLTDIARRAGLLPVVCHSCAAKNSTEQALTRFVDELMKALVDGEEVIFRDFGAFKIGQYRGHVFHSATMGDITVHPKRFVTFAGSRRLKDAMGAGEVADRKPRPPPANTQGPDGKFTSRLKKKGSKK